MKPCINCGKTLPNLPPDSLDSNRYWVERQLCNSDCYEEYCDLMDLADRPRTTSDLEY